MRLCVILVLAAAASGERAAGLGLQGNVAAPILLETENTLWLSPLDTEVCYDLPDQANADSKRLELVRRRPDGDLYIHAMADLPRDASACVNFSAFMGASDATTMDRAYTLRVVDALNRTVLASTEPFALAAMVMTVSGESSATADVFTLRVDGLLSQPETARIGDVMRLVDGSGNVAAECQCYPEGLPIPPASTVRCSFDVPRQMGRPTRGPYEIFFYTGVASEPVSVLVPYAADTANWVALGV